ncbi:MAG: SSI family serine proteinase inhibitor [Aeromicrobium sp.]
MSVLSRLTALTLLAGLAVSGCGKDDESVDGGGTSAATRLKIRVVAADGAEPRTMTLSCAPVGGSHPNASAACAKLAEAGAPIFEPVAGSTTCTMIFGGPQTATISGIYEGEEVDASFSRANGCEIDRWDTLGTEVFDIPLQ